MVENEGSEASGGGLGASGSIDGAVTGAEPLSRMVLRSASIPGAEVHTLRQFGQDVLLRSTYSSTQFTWNTWAHSDVNVASPATIWFKQTVQQLADEGCWGAAFTTSGAFAAVTAAGTRLDRLELVRGGDVVC